MNATVAEAALAELEKALNTGERVGAYLACADVLAALLTFCYTADGVSPPTRAALFAELPHTHLGRQFLPNLEAYARVCFRLDSVIPGRLAQTYPQYTDGLRLLSWMTAQNTENAAATKKFY